MDNSVTTKDLKSIVAQNIFYLRTINQMTQYELGKKLNYSDKAISKWERADGLPDVYVLKKMSELFGVSVDYMLTEHTEQDKKVETKTIKKSKALLGNVIKIGLATISLLVFVIIWCLSLTFCTCNCCGTSFGFLNPVETGLAFTWLVCSCC